MMKGNPKREMAAELERRHKALAEALRTVIAELQSLSDDLLGLVEYHVNAAECAARVAALVPGHMRSIRGAFIDRFVVN